VPPGQAVAGDTSEQKGDEFKASLGYIVRPCLKVKKKTNSNKQYYISSQFYYCTLMKRLLYIEFNFLVEKKHQKQLRELDFLNVSSTVICQLATISDKFFALKVSI
jgi:hypothetical protein